MKQVYIEEKNIPMIALQIKLNCHGSKVMLLSMRMREEAS